MADKTKVVSSQKFVKQIVKIFNFFCFTLKMRPILKNGNIRLVKCAISFQYQYSYYFKMM